METKSGNVRLKRQDGKIITVSIAKLSKLDQSYLRRLARKKVKPKVKPKAKPAPPKVAREETIAAIRKLGGRVEVDGHKAVVEVWFLGSDLTDTGLEKLS